MGRKGSVQDPARLWQAAVAAYERDDPAKARRSLKPLLDHPAADGVTFLLAGLVEARLRDWRRAEKFLRKALQTVPERIEGWVTLGNTLHALGRPEEAAEAFREAATRNPTDPQGWNNLAVVNEDMGRLRDALDYYERALEAASDFPQALHGRATVLGQLRRFDEARQAYEKLLRHFPDDKTLMLEYAEFMEQANRPDEAARYLPGPGSLRDKHADARAEYLRAQLLIRKGELEPALRSLEEARRRTGMDFLSYREGTILDRLGRYPEAMAAFERANEARARQKDYERLLAQPVTEYLQHKLDTGITRPDAQDHEEGTAAGARLTFVTGLPRSGTTLLDRMLNAHPGIQVLEELEGLRMAEAAFAEGAGPEEARRIYWDFVERHVALEAGAMIVDKNPLHVMHLDILPKLFPEARVVFVLRHPYDAALSCFMQDFNPGPVTARFLDLESTAVLCSQFLELMLQYERAVPDTVIRIQYENLVQDFREEVAGLLQTIGLQWHEAIEDYSDIAAKSSPIMTASYEQVTRGLYRSSVERWKHYREWLAPFEDNLGALLAEFGYTP